MLTPTAKGGIAETVIAAEAAKLGVFVLRPVIEGGRYDLVFDVDGRLLRIQCKWARRDGEVLVINARTSRLTPRGYVRTTYSSGEVDAIAAYCAELDRCYLVPMRDVGARHVLYLRLARREITRSSR